MYGVPADLDVSKFYGTTLTGIFLGEFQIQFHFHPDRYIGVEGKWLLHNDKNELIDHSIDENSSRDFYRLHAILGHDVTTGKVTAPLYFELVFDNNYRLTIFDDSDQYESFEIQPGDIYV